MFQINPEKRLFWDLMETYDRNSRPVLNANTSVKVNFAVALKQIMDLVSFTKRAGVSGVKMGDSSETRIT